MGWHDIKPTVKDGLSPFYPEVIFLDEFALTLHSDHLRLAHRQISSCFRVIKRMYDTGSPKEVFVL